ncbi:hypothetical protein [Paenibacillus faecalis]|nr:hypothetical protein [Paenibacillus faecalis]
MNTPNSRTIQLLERLQPYFNGMGDPVRQQIIVLLIDKKSTLGR